MNGHFDTKKAKIMKKKKKTFSSNLSSALEASVTSCSSESANLIASKAALVVTAVILRIPLAVPSSDKRAKASASHVFVIWVPTCAEDKGQYKQSSAPITHIRRGH